MPEQKGRKSKRDREKEQRRARSASAEPATPDVDAPIATTAVEAPQISAQQPAAPQPVPSNAARASGVMLAVVTAIIAVWLAYDALSGDKAGIEVAGRLLAGGLLFALAVVVGVLSLAPEVARRVLRRFMAGRYTVRAGDTLESVARATGFAVRDLRTINPELGDELVAGTTVYLPRPRRR